jgi:hypothetical protein
MRNIQQKERKYYIEERDNYIEDRDTFIEKYEKQKNSEILRKDLLIEKLLEKLHKLTSEYIQDKDVMTEKLHQQTSGYIQDKDKQKDHIHKLEKETLQLRKSLVR